MKVLEKYSFSYDIQKGSVHFKVSIYNAFKA